MQHTNAQLHNKNYLSAKDAPKNSLNNRNGKKKSKNSTKADNAKKPLNAEKRQIPERMSNSQKQEAKRRSLWAFCTF